MSVPQLLTTKEAAVILGKGPRTVQRMAERGVLPVAHKTPGPHGLYLFTREAVEAVAEKWRESRRLHTETAS